MSMMLAALLIAAAQDAPPENTWLKLTPLEGTPISPRLGYEGDCAWDGLHRRIIRYGGHNQGGGGEQNSEVWTFDPASLKWALKEPNTSPPGVCCAQQNAFDPTAARYIRFPSFSGSHGWQWHREIYLNDSSVWSYDLETNLWRNMRPLPAPRLAPLRCASWDSETQSVVVFGGEGSREGTLIYDPHANTWTRPEPSSQPEFRSGGNMAYDAERKVHILFGAQFTDDKPTWAYDARRNEWTDLKPDVTPPTDKNDAVLAYDPVSKTVLCIVKTNDGLQTWSYDGAVNAWKRMSPAREPDLSGNRARVMFFAPELGAVLLENCTAKPREQQVWMWRSAPTEAMLQPARNLRVTTEAGAATLSWDASPSDGVTGYVVYRGTIQPTGRTSIAAVAGLKADERSYRDTGLAGGGIQFYAVGISAADGRVSKPGPRVRAQPRAVEDVVVSVLDAKRVEVAWKPVADAVSYAIERAPVEVLTEDQLTRLKSRTQPLEEPSIGAVRRVGKFIRLEARKGTSYDDTSLDLSNAVAAEREPIWEKTFAAEQLDAKGKMYRYGAYAYRVRAMNALGVEGGPSAAVYTIPSAPQSVFSKADGATCRLKWAANPEKGIRGYRVYRMDGRWDKDTISRLTPDPIADLVYGDPAAGKSTRRYYVVAVDALGQEGHPSSPVWHEREWKQYYLPFTGEWHQ